MRDHDMRFLFGHGSTFSCICIGSCVSKILSLRLIYQDRILHAHISAPQSTVSEFEILDPLCCLLNTLINLIRVRTLANGSRSAWLSTCLATDNWSDSSSPLGSIGTCVLERLHGNVSTAVERVRVCKKNIPRSHNTHAQPYPLQAKRRRDTMTDP